MFILLNLNHLQVRQYDIIISCLQETKTDNTDIDMSHLLYRASRISPVSSRGMMNYKFIYIYIIV
jgi:hypothetical protein